MDHPSPASSQPLTRSDWAHGQLRQAILSGDYGPGDSLVISALAEQMGVSATPLREALRNLASEGFVELQSHGKARVAEVDLQEAGEIYELRLMIEPAALERSVRNADDAYRERVEAAWQALTHRRIAEPSLHANLHRTLLSNCDSAWMLKLATQLADRSGLMISVGIQARSSTYNTAEAHRTLKDLAIVGQAAAAADELRRHLAGSISLLQRIAQQEGQAAASATTVRSSA
ncbi:MAG: GntR family transcriptional regulator [Ilumatobacter sp.]